jgi:hypothetical protein
MFFLGSDQLSFSSWWLWVLGMFDGNKPFDNFGVIHWLTWLVSSKSFYTSFSQLAHPCDTTTIVSSPFHTWPTPFSPPFIYCMCYFANYLYVFVYLFSFFLPHTTLDLNSFNINHHIHRICFSKVHAMVHVIDIPKYFIFLYLWEDNCLILWWLFGAPPPCFLCM